MASDRKKAANIIIALLLPFVVCMIQWLVWDVIKPYAWFLFFPTVFFSFRIGGKTAGIISTLMSAALVVYVFIPPHLSFAGKESTSLFSVGVFLCMGGVFSYTHDRLEKAKAGAAEAREAVRITQERLQEALIGRLQDERRQVLDDLVRSEAALAEDRTLLRTLIDTIPDLIWLKDKDGTYLMCNSGFEKFFGASEKEIVGRTDYDYVDEQLADFFRENDRRAMAAGRPSMNEEWVTFASDGRRVLLEVIKTPMADQAGTFIGVLGIARDLTRVRHAEEVRNDTFELLQICNISDSLPVLAKEALDFFQRVSGCGAIGLRLKEGDDYPYFVTRGLSDAFVMAERGLCGTDCADDTVCSPGGRAHLECLCGHVVCGVAQPCEHLMLMDGALWSNCTSLIETGGGSGSGTSIRGRCISEGYESLALIPLRYHNETMGLLQFLDRKPGLFSSELIALLQNLSIHFSMALAKLKGDASLKESEQFSQQVITFAEEGIVVFGPDLRYKVWNTYMERLTGYPAGVVIGRKPLEVFPFLGTTGIVDRLKRVLSDHTVSSDLVPVKLSPGGTTTWLYDTFAPLRNAANEVIGVIGVVHDISAQKKIEEELHHKNDYLEQFLYSTSHDMRTPLVTVKTFLGFLEADIAAGDRDRLSQDLQFIHLAVDRLKLLLDRLQDLSNADLVKAPPEEVALSAVISNVFETLGGTITAKQAAIRSPETDITLYGSRERFCMVWQNLIENALKFGREGVAPAVELAVRREGDETVFSVQDNGIGIDPRYLSRVFMMFEKLDPHHPGAGLGLSMTKHIVENEGGRIWVESDGPGTGACIRFTLPRAIVSSSL